MGSSLLSGGKNPTRTGNQFSDEFPRHPMMITVAIEDGSDDLHKLRNQLECTKI